MNRVTKIYQNMKSIIFYGNRNTGIYVLSYLVAQGYQVKVITDDKEVEKIAGYYNFTTFAAAGPLAPSTMSNETRAPSSRDLNPSA